MSGLQALTSTYRFHYYDQRGCGQSTRPVDHFDSSNTYKNMTTLDRTLGLAAWRIGLVMMFGALVWGAIFLARHRDSGVLTLPEPVE